LIDDGGGAAAAAAAAIYFRLCPSALILVLARVI
jgi:hypothetical protein